LGFGHPLNHKNGGNEKHTTFKWLYQLEGLVVCNKSGFSLVEEEKDFTKIV
jgi:hypothetical protein